MDLRKKVAIVGVYEHETRHAPDRTSFQIQAECAKRALEEAGLTKDEVDAVYTADIPGHASAVFSEYLNVFPRHLDSTYVGGSSFLLHVRHAIAAIASGQCQVALISYAATPRSRGTNIGTGGFRRERLEAVPDSFEFPFGATTVGVYAMAAQRHMYEYGTTSEQLAEIAVTARRHAALNPNAMFRDPIAVEDVLRSRMISSPLHLLDCCVISDGGGAVVLTSAERARSLRKQPVYILGAGESIVHTAGGLWDVTTMAAKKSGEEAFRMAGVTHGDIDMCMIYDSFTITVLSTLENLGFCKKGEGGHFVQDGRIALGGDLPINTDGGGLSSNHPGMRGIFLVIEATRQLRGECGPRQVKNCEIALCHGTGGGLSTRHSGVTLILERG